MPDSALPPVTPPASAAPSSIPPGSTAGAPTSANWRGPADGPAWARGKSPEEILGIANTLVDMYSNGGTPTRDDAPPPPAAAPAPSIADDEYVSGAQLKQFLAAASAPHAASTEMIAAASLGIVRQQYSADFTKYGPEISAKLARVPKNLWTLDNLETVVKMVRSDHLDEIAHERAQQIVSGMPPTLRSTGAAAPSDPVTREHSLESEKIPAEWKRRAAENGVTERVVEEFCRANDLTPAAFYKQFDTPLNKIVEDHGKRPSA